MPHRARQADHGRARRTAWKTRAGCLGYLLICAGVVQAPEVIGRALGLRYLVAFSVLAAGAFALIKTLQVHRRGQTIAEAIAASRADRRHQAERRLLQRAERRGRARHEAALPWLKDQQLSPRALPGVVITPALDTAEHDPGGHYVVLGLPGDRRIQVIGQLRRLTRLSFKEAKDLVDAAPVPVIRVPDMAMAQAVKYVLESAGATASITGPAS
jgi:ribosomal protein L7/L12